MLAAIKSFFSDWFGGAAEHDSFGGVDHRWGFGGGRGFGGVNDFGGFSAEYGSGDFWATGSHAPGASRELLVAEADYERRLQNTLDANTARSALQRGDTGAAISILNRNPEVGVSIGGVELYGTTGARFLETQGEAARVAAQQGIDRAGQIRTNLNGQANATTAASTDNSSSSPDFAGGVINIPVGAGDTQWDVVRRSLAEFARASGLPADEQAQFVSDWTQRLQAGGETSLYHYTTEGRRALTSEEFAAYQRTGVFPSYLTSDRQPVIIADLQRRLAELDGEVVRIEVNGTRHSEEGFGSFLAGALAGGFSDNDSWSAIGGQTVVGLIPVVGQVADARDIIAAGRDVYHGKEGGWAGLGIAAIAVIPGLDFLKGGARAGRKLLAETAERGLSEISRESVERLSTTLSREGTERASRELITLSVGREEMMARLEHLSNDSITQQSTRAALRAARNSLEHSLTQEDLIGALRDVHGMPVVINGRVYDHLEEVDQAINSLDRARREVLRNMHRYHPGTPEYRRFSHEAEALQEMVGRVEGFLKIN